MAKVGINQALVITTYKDAGGTVTVKTETVTGDTTLDLDGSGVVANNAWNEFDVNITQANIVALGIGVSKTRGESTSSTTKATIKTNASNNTADDTFDVTGTNGVGWSSGDPVPCPITTDVTKLFISNTGTGKVDFLVRVLSSNQA